MNINEVPRVLIAEDDFLVGQAIRQAVQEIGYAVVAEISSGEIAVEKTCELHPDVVLMDIQMPGLDGLQATEVIQTRCPTPVVVLTAYESQELVETASEKGVGAYLTKPPNPLEIKRAITIAMSRHADLMTLRKLYQELEQQNRELQQALEEIKTLRGILPICAHCKKIRDDSGYWNQLEAYISTHADVEFSHGICPDCIKEFYPDLAISED